MTATLTQTTLRISGLSKTFPGTRALIDASLDIRPGEVHAMIGQNGSGKSTLIKTLAGYHRADPGAVAELGGERADDRRLRHARQPEQEDGLAVGQRARQQPQLVAAPDHVAADR